MNWVRIFTEGRWKRAALVLPVLFALWLVLTVAGMFVDRGREVGTQARPAPTAQPTTRPTTPPHSPGPSSSAATPTPSTAPNPPASPSKPQTITPWDDVDEALHAPEPSPADTTSCMATAEAFAARYPKRAGVSRLAWSTDLKPLLSDGLRATWDHDMRWDYNKLPTGTPGAPKLVGVQPGACDVQIGYTDGHTVNVGISGGQGKKWLISTDPTMDTR